MKEWLTNFVNDYVVGFGVKLVFAIIILLVGFALANWFAKLIGKSKLLNKADPNVQMLIVNIIRIGFKVIVIITAVITVGVPQASVIAVLGSCGLAIGLALQGGLGNIASSLILLLCKPFHVGDYIEAGSVTGVVKDIGIYYTKVTTADNYAISVPNSTLANSSIVNLSMEQNRRVDFDFNVAYGTDLDLARKVLLAIADKNDLVLKEPAPVVYVSAHGQSSLTVRLRIWCASSDYWTVYFDMWEDVKRAFDKFKIEIPFNHLNVTIDNK